MSKPWYENGTQARVYRVLLAQPTKSLDYDALRELLPDLANNIVSQTLNRLKVQGYVRRGLALQGAKPAWSLVPGRAAPPIVDEQGAPVVLAAPTPTADQLTRGAVARFCALALAAHNAGYDSGTLAEQAGCTAQLVDEALLPALLDNRLSSCRVMRYGVTLMHYRLSGSTAGYDWAERAEHAWQHQAEQLQAALEARRPIDVPAPVAAAPAARAAAPAPAPKAEPAPAPKAVLVNEVQVTINTPAPALTMSEVHRALADQIRKAAPNLRPASPAVETASEVVEPQAPAAPAPKVPVVGELDIDAVHRRQAGAGAEEPEGEFLTALYSNGKLMISTHGQRVTLPLEHTRKLLHYLDHLRCSEMVADMLGVLS